MKLNTILAGLTMLFLGACSYGGSGNQNNGGPVAKKEVQEMQIQENGDSDGDLISDSLEVAKGRNPFVADMPELKVRFLQSYRIDVPYKKKGEELTKLFTFNTDNKDTDPDYKYRVGKVFARNNAYKTAASFGRFSSHTVGKIEERDFSWVSYPEVDPKLYNMKAIEFRNLITDEDETNNVSIRLTNQVQLVPSTWFKEVKNLKLNFYFYNHQTENYELLKTAIIERHFQAGIYETFDVEISNVPISLVRDSFFKRGEFIISEVEDYEIPELNTRYKHLKQSVSATTVPVLYETPLEEKLSYVSTYPEGVRFQNILKVIFDRNYKIENDELTDIGQFKNNLPSYTHLKEVKDKDKVGKWFVMTNEIPKNYLDHVFTNKDHIVIAYATGADLSNQQSEKIYSYKKEANPNKSETIVPLGNITPNSKVNFQLRPLARYGRELSKTTESFDRPGGSCGKNCIQQPIHCKWEINLFKDYSESFSFLPDLSGEAERLDLVVNGEAYSLKILLLEKKILVSQTETGTHFTINDINLIKELRDVDENQLGLRVKAFQGSDFFGVKLTEMGGIWNGVGGCPFNTPAVAEKFRTQISKETKEIGEISWLINDLANRGYGYRFQLLDSGPYYQEISFAISSTIENLYN
ncbi:hypothetical protein DOM21_14920 [Bacteriovorax stolpii]|uniref:hypothetical protein n=1 Tax=Bacteriovorax stolpii TaxID=960 RepID=UPI0011595DCA|nr:hypothetical protein [Bacteriovorax stolpii]QDK42719.1 hypothetical protein DOM21_14920 [Bacteriovorax stolpii]